MKEQKNLVSLRLEDSVRNIVQQTATRFYVRESDIYRVAINFMLKRFSCLNDESYTGSDLLPLMLEIREELISSLSLRKIQLFKIINGNNVDPEKFVAMSDIELLLCPEHLLQQNLKKVDEKDRDVNDHEAWLKAYLLEKYKVKEDEARRFLPD